MWNPNSTITSQSISDRTIKSDTVKVASLLSKDHIQDMVEVVNLLSKEHIQDLVKFVNLLSKEHIQDTVKVANPLSSEHIQDNGKTSAKPTSLHPIGLEYKLHLLASPVDRDHLCPIHYSNEYIPQRPQWLVPQQISFDQILAGPQQYEKKHGIPLHFKESGLPTHTGIFGFRQSRYWESIVRVTTELLELFATDQSCNELTLSKQSKPTNTNGSIGENHDMNGTAIKENHMRSMASLARDELNNGILDSWCRFTVYMWPDADEERSKLTAQSIVLSFMFDDVWETLSGQDQIIHLRESLLSRLSGSCSPSSSFPPTPLQASLDSIRTGLLAYGNCGAEALEGLLAFFRHGSPPKEGFRSVRDYLDHRWDDVGLRYMFALTAFSIGFSPTIPPPIDPSSPLYTFLLRLGDSIAINNDLASFDKELAAYGSGKATSIINVVDVVMKCERVGAEAAKSMALAWALYSEDAAVAELKRLAAMEGEAEGGRERTGGEEEGRALSAEEWAFAEACLVTASGNVATNVSMKRYGGEGSRIRV